MFTPISSIFIISIILILGGVFQTATADTEADKAVVERWLAIGYDNGPSFRLFVKPQLALEFGLSASSLFSSSSPYRLNDELDSFQYSILTSGNIVFPFDVTDKATLNLILGGGRKWEITYTDERKDGKTYQGDSFYFHLLLGPEVSIFDKMSFEPRFGIRNSMSSVFHFSGDDSLGWESRGFPKGKGDRFKLPDYDFMKLHFVSQITFRWYF